MLLQFAKYNFIIYHFIKPYEITLFSNYVDNGREFLTVLLPYEITLFSNEKIKSDIELVVLLPYEITLFSNRIMFSP